MTTRIALFWHGYNFWPKTDISSTKSCPISWKHTLNGNLEVIGVISDIVSFLAPQKVSGWQKVSDVSFSQEKRYSQKSGVTHLEPFEIEKIRKNHWKEHEKLYNKK